MELNSTATADKQSSSLISTMADKVSKFTPDCF